MTDRDSDRDPRLLRQIELITAAEPRDGARRRANELLIDALGVAVAGRDEPVSRAAAAALEGASPDSRAYVLAAQMHALDYDDTHEPSLCHTAVAILPGLIELARLRHRSGAQLLRAYDAGLRLVHTLAPLGIRANETGLHSTAVIGTLGAALACSWLLDEDARRAADAVELAALGALGLAAAFGTDAKPLQAARSAETGMRAAMLASAGAGAPHAALLGEHGLVRRLFGENAAASVRWGEDGAAAVFDVAVKPYPSCLLTHSTIDAMLEARAVLGSAACDVERIDIAVHPIAAGIADMTVLRVATDAKFSLRFCARAALTQGAVGVATFDHAAWSADPDWDQWVRRCSVRADASLPRLGARIVVSQGSEMRFEVGIDAPRGSISAPLTGPEMLEKFRGNVAAVLPSPLADDLAASLRRIAQAADLADLPPLDEILAAARPTPLRPLAAAP